MSAGGKNILLFIDTTFSQFTDTFDPREEKRTMANITILDKDDPKRKRYKVTYECRTISGSRKRCAKTFPPGTKKREIESFKRKMEEEYENSEGLDYTKRSLEQFIEEYFDVYRGWLSPSTIKGYQQMANSPKHGIIPNLGKMELDKIKTSDIQRYCNYLSQEKLSGKTVKNHILFLHTLYDSAMKMGYVKRGYNIVSGVVRPRWQKKHVESYSDEEIRQILELVDKYADDMTRLIFYLAFGTGMRRSEMAALKVDSIDFSKKLINITHAKVEGLDGDVLKEPKTSAGARTIPVGDTLCTELKKAVNRYRRNKLSYGEGFSDEGYLFSHEDGKPFATNYITSKYIKFMKKYATDIRYLPLHTAGRHSFASILISQGCDVKGVQEILGHSDASVTLNTYANSFFKQKQEYATKVDELIFSKQA